MRTGREVVDIEQRHRAARDLLRATVRITIQRLQDGGRVERRRQACRQRHAAGARDQIGEHIRGQRQALALGQRPDRAARQDLRRRLDVERIVPRQRQPVRSLDVDVDIGGSGAAGFERQRHRGALLGGEFHRGRGIARHLDGACDLDIDGVVAGRAFDVVEVETHGALVAVEQEARQGRGQHHRIAHGDVDRGAAEFGRRPRHRHHPRGAGEFGNVEADLRRTVGADRDDAGIERQRLLRGRAALQFAAGGVAAGFDLAAGALHAVDQLSVEVADLRGQAALAEIVIVRRRRLVVGQVEDADVDGGNDDLGVFAGIEPAELDRNLQRAARAHQRRRREVDRQRAVLLVDAEPFQPDRAAGHAQRGGIERTAQGCQHIGAGAPILADGNFDLGGAFLDVDGLRRQQAVAQHVDGQLAGGARIDGHHHGVAGLIFRLVDRGLQQVRRIGAAVGVPADVELHRGDRPIQLGRFDIEAIAAGLRRERHPRRLVGGESRGRRRRRGGSI